jgi:hypothetical protein
MSGPASRRPNTLDPLPWVVRVLSAAYPREFRDTYRDDLQQCIRDARAALKNTSPAARAGFWLRTSVDLAGAGLREHAGSWRAAPRRSAPLRLLGFASLALATANVLVDFFSAELQMGIGALLLTSVGLAAGALLTRDGPSPPPDARARERGP